MANVYPDEQLGWTFIGLIRKDEVMQHHHPPDLADRRHRAAAGCAFAVVGAAFAKLIVRPINSVSRGLEDIAQGEGDLTRNLEIRGRDETAQLANWFNQFLAAIRSLIQHIGAAASKILSTSSSSTRVPMTWPRLPGASVKRWTWCPPPSTRWSPPPTKLRVRAARPRNRPTAASSRPVTASSRSTPRYTASIA
jgi:methyl-accepting chemotaxis protein